MAQDSNELKEIVVPELGESVLEATVSRWLKQKGEAVSAGEPVVELETDKVNLEVAAPANGVIVRIDRQEGEDVQIGDVLGAVEEKEVQTSGKPAKEAAPGLSRDGEERQPEPQSTTAHPQTVSRAESPEREEKATPVAERLAQERDVDLAKVRGTGPGGRVTRGDVEGYLESRQAQAKEAPAEPKEAPQKTEAPRPAQPVFIEPANGERPEERIRMSRRRRTIAERLVEAQRTAAMLTTFNEVDMTAVMELRKRRNESFQEQHGVKLGITSFFVKAAVGALKAFPQINAEIQGDELILKYYYDIGIAVGAEEGLVVPVLRNAERLSFAEIERRINEFVQKSRSGNLTLEDLRGGTFTITNGGVFGSLLSTPILSPPQAAILGLHKIEKRPIALNDEVVIRPMMYLALSYDHRIVDGREAVQFLVKIKELIEDPETMLLEG